MPAARVAENVVRVPEAFGLFLYGMGAFEIPDNHFACGGQVATADIPLAQTVLMILWKLVPRGTAGDVIKLAVYVVMLALVGVAASYGQLPRTRPIVPGELMVGD